MSWNCLSMHETIALMQALKFALESLRRPHVY